MALAKRYYSDDDVSVLPRNIANFKAFENAMTLDIAMGGSSNTVLHLLAAAQEAEVDFTMTDIDRLSRKVPHLCKVAPSTPKYHMEDVHRAGGVMGILGELERAGLLHTDVNHVASDDGSLESVLANYDVMRTESAKVKDFFRAGPAGIPTTQPSARIAAGHHWIQIAAKVVSAAASLPSVRKGAWRYCPVIWPSMAA